MVTSACNGSETESKSLGAGGTGEVLRVTVHMGTLSIVYPGIDCGEDRKPSTPLAYQM